MGDAGSNLLGLLLACVAIQGVLKTAAVVALFFPLVILAVPALDATFVVAKRIKYRKPVYSADRWHFHHRFANIGFSQRRTVLYLYGWTLSLAALALAMRFVPYSDDGGNLNAGWSARDRRLRPGRASPRASTSCCVLEILKFRRFRERQLRRAVETGEMRRAQRDADRATRSSARSRRASSRPSTRLIATFLTCSAPDRDRAGTLCQNRLAWAPDAPPARVPRGPARRFAAVLGGVAAAAHRGPAAAAAAARGRARARLLRDRLALGLGA